MDTTDTRPPGKTPAPSGDGAGGPAGAAVTPAHLAAILARIRERRPLVHASMNTVAQAFVANTLTALGADVSMTSAAGEVGEMVARSDVLLVNLGTLDLARREGIAVATDAARAARVPVVLDPVKVDRAPGRRTFARTLLEGGIDIVKGNPPEMDALGPVPDRTVRIVTGPGDLVGHGKRQARILNGTSLLAQVIATGCAGGAVIAAARAVEDDPFRAALAGLAIWSVAAEIAAVDAPGPGTFAVRLIDSVAALSPYTLADQVRLDA